ncbi:MAG: DNA mismatch repair protein MutS, partial [Proteobacteria bacterium]|nr:DNA mismatch repair protein MutS [Pseudomonadota bacterium]
TSTFDGLSLAWACAEKLVRDINAYTLFATHYFELTQIPELYERASNVHLDAIEHGDKIVFLHQLKPGPANQSYGLQVAQLAGVPNDVIKAAKVKLAELESKRQNTDTPQTDLFEKVAEVSLLEQYLQQIDPDELTPKQAQEKLYQLIALL